VFIQIGEASTRLQGKENLQRKEIRTDDLQWYLQDPRQHQSYT